VRAASARVDSFMVVGLLCGSCEGSCMDANRCTFIASYRIGVGSGASVENSEQNSEYVRHVRIQHLLYLW
jgi:hypothetical protein